MNTFQACWNSISCLEGWERTLRLTGVVVGLITLLGGAFTLTGAIAFYKIGQRIAVLKDPRILTKAQIEMITNALRDKPKAEFQVTSWADSEESVRYGGQLHKVLKDVGWNSNGLTRFYMDGGEPPPNGITLMVDGLHQAAKDSATQLAEVLHTLGIEVVRLETESTKPPVSSWVLIKVGRKGSH